MQNFPFDKFSASAYLESNTTPRRCIGNRYNIMESMFQIKIDDTVQAVSPSLESALKALPGVICRYTGIRNPGSIEYGDKNQGINYMPWCHSVNGTAKVSDEVLTIFITKIPVV